MQWFDSAYLWAVSSWVNFFITYFSGCFMVLILTILLEVISHKYQKMKTEMTYVFKDYANLVLGSWFSLAVMCMAAVFFGVKEVFCFIAKIICGLFRIKTK